MSESRAQRQAALEERRRRIASLREARNQRVEDTARVQQQHQQNLDDYVSGLLSEPRPGEPAEASGPASAPEAPSSADTTEPTSLPAVESSSSTTTTPAQVAPVAPLVKKVETFTIATQTEEADFVEKPELEGDDEKQTDTTNNSSTPAETTNHKNETQQHHIEPDQDPKILSNQELEKEVSKAPFSTFINTASKKVERMLGTPLLSDLLVDYDAAEQQPAQETSANNDKYISDREIYQCPKWTAGREITDLDWSPLHRELFLSTHHSSSSNNNSISTAVSAIAPHDTPSASLTPRSGELQSDGLALIWSLSMPTRPEHVFTCGSPVTAGRFHPTDATMVVGGCVSGQVVVWDIRAGRLPVQKSALVVTGKSSQHTHPISNMAVLEGGTGLVTSSTDGKVNFWSLSNLREPAESLQLGESVSCFSVAPESGTLVLGDENGSIYAATATSGQRRRQVRKFDSGDGGHYGMVTSLSTKFLKKGDPSRTVGLSKGFLRGGGGLVLSAGVDWTVQLWAPAYKDEPLTSIVSHSYDYMSDVKWSPAHPSMFATASSNGVLGLWNLAKSLEEPETTVAIDADASRGLNKLSWSLDGRRLAVASSDQVHLVHLTEHAIRTKGDEDAKAMMNHMISRGWITRQ